MSIRNEIAKSNAIFVFGKNFSAVIAIAFAVILPRLLKPYDFGLYSFCIFVMGFSRIFTNLGMDETLVRFTANYVGKGAHDKAATIARTIFKYKLTLALIIGASISLLSSQIASQIFRKPEASFMVFLAGFLLISLALYDFFTNLLFGTKNVKGASIIHVSYYLLKFALVVGLLLLGFGTFGAVLGTAFSYIGASLVGAFIVYKSSSFIFTAPRTAVDKKDIFTFSMWLFIVITVGGIYGLVDQTMIARMLNIEDIGFYKIALSWMFAIINIIPISTQVLFPYFSSIDKSKVDVLFFNSIRYVALLIFPAAFLMSALSGPFVVFFYGMEYLPVSPVLKVLAIVSVPTMLTMILYTFYSGIKKPEIIAKVVTSMMILNVILNYFFIQEYGIIGAAIATLIAKTTEFIILFSLAISQWNLTFSYSSFIKPLVVSALGTSVAFSQNITGVGYLAAYSIAFLIFYAVVMIAIKGITREDIGHVEDLTRSAARKIRSL